MTAIPYRARAATRPRRSRNYRRGGVWTYVWLLLLTAFSIFPLYWSFVVASHDNSALGAYPPVLTPGGNFRDNVDRLFNAGIVNVDFAKALVNSAIVASVTTAPAGASTAPSQLTRSSGSVTPSSILTPKREIVTDQGCGRRSAGARSPDVFVLRWRRRPAPPSRLPRAPSGRFRFQD